MAIRNKRVSTRSRFGIAAVSLAMFATFALATRTSASQTGATSQSGAVRSQAPGSTASNTFSAANEAAAKQKARSLFASMPLYFEANQGQTDPSVR
jgi:hypothetical protein